MKVFLRVLCVALVTQLGAVLGEAEQNIPERFKVGQALQFDQDAGDKAATRSVTSSELDNWASAPVQTSLTPENADSETESQVQPEEHREEVNGDDARDEAHGEENQDQVEQPFGNDDELQKLAERSIDDFESKNQLDSEEGAETDADQELDARGLLESGMNMVPSSLRNTASSLRQTAESMGETAKNIYNNPQVARETIQNALNNAKDKVPDLRQKMQEMYKTGLDQGINMYKELNKRLSPSMARTLNQGVSSALRGVQAAKESPIAKTISEKISTYLP